MNPKGKVETLKRGCDSKSNYSYSIQTREKNQIDKKQTYKLTLQVMLNTLKETKINIAYSKQLLSTNITA